MAEVNLSVGTVWAQDGSPEHLQFPLLLRDAKDRQDPHIGFLLEKTLCSRWFGNYVPHCPSCLIFLPYMAPQEYMADLLTKLMFHQNQFSMVHPQSWFAKPVNPVTCLLNHYHPCPIVAITVLNEILWACPGGSNYFHNNAKMTFDFSFFFPPQVKEFIDIAQILHYSQSLIDCCLSSSV